MYCLASAIVALCLPTAPETAGEETKLIVVHFVFWLKSHILKTGSYAHGLARALVAAVNFKNQMRQEKDYNLLLFVIFSNLFLGTSSATWRSSKVE